MNEAVQVDLPEQGPSVTHGGMLLKQHRLARGIHLASLSAVLKVPVARLEALEDGRLDELPDLIFTRALAGSVCRALKMDPAPVLAALPLPPVSGHQAPLESLEKPSPSGLPLSAAAPEEHVIEGSRSLPVKRISSWLVLVLLVFGFGWWWQQQGVRTVVDAPVSTAAPVSVAADVAPSTAPAPTLPLTSSAPPTAVDVPAAQPAVPAPLTESVQPAGPSALQPPALRLLASNTTWVQVQGASGKLRFERTLQAGESVDFTDDLPLRVVLGRAEVVEVQVQGQPFDLQPHTRSSVARFEVR